jgi:hypothetical protein
MRKYLVKGGNTYLKAKSCPNGRQHTDINVSCLGTVVCVLANVYRVYVCMYVCMYIISVVVLQIYFTRIVQIDNNQRVYEVQIQVPRCNSILKAGSHECQKLGYIVSNSYWGHHDSLLPASSKHHCLHTLCPCIQALTCVRLQARLLIAILSWYFAWCILNLNTSHYVANNMVRNY